MLKCKFHHLKFSWNSFQFSNFTFVQLSTLNSKFIQFKSTVQFCQNFALRKILFSHEKKKSIKLIKIFYRFYRIFM